MSTAHTATTKELAALNQELSELLAKRTCLREAQMKRRHEGSATRARTTTGNANVDRVNERIVWVREQIAALTAAQGE